MLKLLNKCCQQVEETLYGHHGQCIDQSSRQVQYVCQCNRSKDVHYIIIAKKPTCSDFIHCRMDRCTRPMTPNESMWFEGDPVTPNESLLLKKENGEELPRKKLQEAAFASRRKLSTEGQRLKCVNGK